MRAADVQVRCKYVDKCIHGRKCINCWRKGNYDYHVYDLLQGEAELQPHCLGLVEHRPLQAVVELRWKVSTGFTIFGEGPHYFVLISHQRISKDTVLSWHLNKAAAAGTLTFIKWSLLTKVSSNIVKTIAKFRCHLYLQQVIEQSPLIRPAINLWNVHFIAEGIVKIFYCCLFDQSSQPALLLSSNIEPSLIGWRGGGSYIRKRKSQKHKLDIWIESSCPASGR